MRREPLARWTAVAYLVLSFYVFGCLVIENEVNYSVWHLIGPAELAPFHRAIEARLGPFMFLPMTLHLVANGLLLFFRPAALSRGLVGVALLLNAYVIVESLLVQVPIHQRLGEAPTPELLQQLISTHRLYRLPGEVAAFVTSVVMLARLTRGPAHA